MLAQDLATSRYQDGLSFILLAIVTCAYAALAGYTWYKTFPNVVANNASHPWLCLIGIFVAVFLSPVAEELFFRGWLWIGLRRTWSAFPTALVTALFWLAVHLDQGFGIFIFLIPVATILTIARQVAKSSRAPIALHAIYNLVASGLPLTLGLLASVPEPAKASLPAVSLSRNALSGNEVQISAMNFVNVDCSSGPVPNVRVVTPPKNGSVRLDQTTITVDRPKDNARAHCNGKSVKAMGVYYKSSSGFNGNDEVVFDTDFLEGTVWRYVVTINVR